MRMSNYFLPTLKEVPSDAQIASHRLMLRAGMIRQASAGIYSWLPIGLRVLRNIENIVREEQNVAGCQEILMPTIQSADLWKESGRYEGYGKEMLRIRDRHDRDLLYGPTNEEQITDIFRHSVKSYRDLPKLLYHIQWKFRDEVRPRFGIMRGREFLMKDSYSFDLDKVGAVRAYNKMFVAYLKTFARMGLTGIPMRADAGPIGGDLSHEFVILADTGESEVACHRDLLDLDLDCMDLDSTGDFGNVVDSLTNYYAATDEERDPEIEASLGDDLVVRRGIEVGHIFYFGTKYSKPMGAKVTGPDGEDVLIEMGSYGIGVSRLVGAIIEAYHDDDGIIWPDAVAPFGASIINLKVGDKDCDAACEDFYAKLSKAGLEPIYDDRDERAGAKFADMDLIGIPRQLVVGPRSLKNGMIELKSRGGGELEELSPDEALNRLTAGQAEG